MLSVSEIREDLKDIKYYYSRKDLFDKAFQTTGGNVIVDKALNYNNVVKLAPPKLYEVYVALYVQNHTQESFADKLCYSTQYVQVLNRKLLKFIQMNYEKANSDKGEN